MAHCLACLLADLRYAVRSLSKAPAFTLLVIASLALGLGGSTAIFTLLDQIVLRPLPVERPHELVQLAIRGTFSGNSWGNGTEIPHPLYRDLRDHNRVFSGMFARYPYAMHVTAGAATERASGELVSGSYFPVLGVTPAIGRLFTAADDLVPGGHPVAVLGYDYWRLRFHGDPAIVGREISVNDHAFTVIGVAARGFHGIDVGRATQIYVPMMMKAQMTPGWDALDDRRSRFARVFARLRPGVTPRIAAASLQPLFAAIREDELGDRYFASASAYEKAQFRRATLEVTQAPRGNAIVRDTMTRPLYTLVAIVVGLLLVAGANVAGLLLARGMARQREVAIRLAIGASRARVIGQLLVESLLLALAGGAAGLLVAAWGSSLLLRFIAHPEIATGISATPDARVLAFSLLLALATGLLCGGLPAWQASRPVVAGTLKDQAGSVIGGGPVRARRLLVSAQVALALLLLAGAGLFVRSLSNLLEVDAGFDVEQLVTFKVEPSLNGYARERRLRLARTLIERLSQTPGVSRAAIAGGTLLTGGAWNTPMTVEGYSAQEGEEVTAYNNSVMPGFFATMGIPLLRGRDFTEQDARMPPPPDSHEPEFRVAIANQRFVERYFGSTDPIGRRVGFATGGDAGTARTIEIIGVVATAKYRTIRDEAEPQLFFPMLEERYVRPLTLYVRAAGSPEAAPPEAILPELRRVVHAIDPNLPVFEMRRMTEQVQRSVVNERMVAWLSAVLGVMATLIGAIGLYGVMAYAVTRRTREVGIRMALGAPAARVAWLFGREALRLVACGVGVALPALWGAGRLIRSQLFGVDAWDPAILLGATFTLGLVATLGALAPALRAARIDPLVALRKE